MLSRWPSVLLQCQSLRRESKLLCPGKIEIHLSKSDYQVRSPSEYQRGGRRSGSEAPAWQSTRSAKSEQRAPVHLPFLQQAPHLTAEQNRDGLGSRLALHCCSHDLMPYRNRSWHHAVGHWQPFLAK